MERIKLIFTAAFLIIGLSVHSQNVIHGSIVGITEIDINFPEDMSNKQLEKFFLEEFLPAFSEAFPTVPFSLLKGDRGNRAGKYTEFYVFESLEERNRWFPEEGVSSAETKECFKQMGEIWIRYQESLSNPASSTYLVLPDSIPKQNVIPGNVVSIAEIDLKLPEDMTFEQFEKFYLGEFLPAFAETFPTIQFSLLKGDRGDRTGKYTEFIVFQSLEERNRWFPVEGGSSAETKQGFKQMGEIWDKYMELVSNSDWTNYLVLPDTTVNTIQFDLETETISLYPNPVSDYLNIELKNSNLTYVFELYNLVGQKIFFKEIGINEKINLKTLNNGLYIYNIHSDGIRHSGKLMKE